MEKAQNYAQKKLGEKAERLASDGDAVIEIVDQGEEKLKRNSSALKDAYKELVAFFKFLRAYYKGEYRDVSKMTLVSMILAVLYFMLPTDFLPDFIPGLGFIDDISVIMWVARKVKKELDQFIQFSENQD